MTYFNQLLLPHFRPVKDGPNDRTLANVRERPSPKRQGVNAEAVGRGNPTGRMKYRPKFLFPIALAILLGASDVVEATHCCNGAPDHPCDWWNPCPPPVPDPKKRIAQLKADWWNTASSNFIMIGASCSPWLPASKICVSTAAGMAALAKTVAEDYAKVARDPLDPDYYQIYSPPWPSAEELGLSYSEFYGNYNNAIWYAQAIHMLADLVYVSGNRVTSCLFFNAGCAPYQQPYVDWGLWMLGAYTDGLGNELWNLAAQVEQEGDADEVVAWLVSWIRAAAWESNDAGWRFEQ